LGVDGGGAEVGASEVDSDGVGGHEKGSLSAADGWREAADERG
jgi:hypothetical protein